ncbi:MAG: hypothetical protein ACRC26_06525, partial [Bacteroidales bacterium]
EKEEKEESDDSDYFILLESYRETYQLSLTSKLSESFIALTGIDYSLQSGTIDKRDYGFHIFQSLKHRWNKIELIAAMSIYYSDKGKMSFYSVNKQINTGSLFTRLSGNGYKLGTSLKWNLNENCKLSLSYSFLKCRDKEFLYSGLSKVASNFENMLSIYYSWRF